MSNYFQDILNMFSTPIYFVSIFSAFILITSLILAIKYTDFSGKSYINLNGGVEEQYKLFFSYNVAIENPNNITLNEHVDEIADCSDAFTLGIVSLGTSLFAFKLGILNLESSFFISLLYLTVLSSGVVNLLKGIIKTPLTIISINYFLKNNKETQMILKDILKPIIITILRYIFLGIEIFILLALFAFFIKVTDPVYYFIFIVCIPLAVIYFIED